MSSSPAVVPEAPDPRVKVLHETGVGEWPMLADYQIEAMLAAADAVDRVRAALGAAVRRADAAEAETTRVSLAFAEWVNISTNEMTAERAKHAVEAESIRRRIDAAGMALRSLAQRASDASAALLDEGRA